MRTALFISATLYLGFILSPTMTFAGDTKGITIEAPWARASVLISRPGAAFLKIVNKGAEPDRLIKVESPAARHITIHASTMKDGVMKMAPLHTLEIGAGEHVELKPGDRHLMLMKLHQSLRKGESFPITLQFENAGKVSVIVPVYSLGAKGPGSE